MEILTCKYTHFTGTNTNMHNGIFISAKRTRMCKREKEREEKEIYIISRTKLKKRKIR